jgi:hypothetical protein
MGAAVRPHPNVLISDDGDVLVVAAHERCGHASWPVGTQDEDVALIVLGGEEVLVERVADT